MRSQSPTLQSCSRLWRQSGRPRRYCRPRARRSPPSRPPTLTPSASSSSAKTRIPPRVTLTGWPSPCAPTCCRCPARYATCTRRWRRTSGSHRRRTAPSPLGHARASFSSTRSSRYVQARRAPTQGAGGSSSRTRRSRSWRHASRGWCSCCGGARRRRRRSSSTRRTTSSCAAHTPARSRRGVASLAAATFRPQTPTSRAEGSGLSGGRSSRPTTRRAA